jgi:hypothetical protein
MGVPKTNIGFFQKNVTDCNFFLKIRPFIPVRLPTCRDLARGTKLICVAFPGHYYNLRTRILEHPVRYRQPVHYRPLPRQINLPHYDEGGFFSN